MSGGPQHGSAALTRREADYFAFADRCAGAGEPVDTFYASPARAQAICEGCPVRVACLAYALRSGERWGVWGGLTEAQRRELKRAQSAGNSLRPIMAALA